VGNFSMGKKNYSILIAGIIVSGTEKHSVGVAHRSGTRDCALRALSSFSSETGLPARWPSRR
jgi:hypothetical protein